MTSKALLCSIATLLLPVALHGAPFTPGDLVIYRVGDGVAGLASSGTAVFLDEYSPTGTLVQSIAMPTVVSGSNHQLVASGTATSEGLLNLSADGRFLTATGYAAAIGTASIAGTTSAAVNRTVGLVKADGSVDTSTALTDAYSANNIRSAITTDGTTIFVTGTAANPAGGVRSTILGGTTSTQLNSTVTNVRDVNITGGQLYISSGSGTTRIATVGTGVPTTSGQTITNLPGITSTNSISPYQFFLADLSPTVAGVDTLYVADDGTGGGLQKYSLDGGTWTLKGTIGSSTDAHRGLTGSVNNGVVSLFAVGSGGGGATGGGKLFSVTDASGYDGAFAGTPTLLATASANEAFRGVSFAPTDLSPIPEPATWLFGLGLVTFAGFRRTRAAVSA